MKLLLGSLILILSLEAFQSINTLDGYDKRTLRFKLLEQIEFISKDETNIEIESEILFKGLNTRDYSTEIISNNLCSYTDAGGGQSNIIYFISSQIVSKNKYDLYCRSNSETKHCNAPVENSCSANSNVWNKLKIFIPPNTINYSFKVNTLYIDDESRSIKLHLKYIDKSTNNNFNQLEALKTSTVEDYLLNNKVVEITGTAPGFELNKDITNTNGGWIYLSMSHIQYDSEKYFNTEIESKLNITVTKDFLKWFSNDQNFKEDGTPYDKISTLVNQYTQCNCIGAEQKWFPENKISNIGLSISANQNITYNGLLALSQIITPEDLKNGISEEKYETALNILVQRYKSSNIDEVIEKLFTQIQKSSVPKTFWINDTEYIDDIENNLTDENKKKILDGKSDQDLMLILISSGIAISVIKDIISPEDLAQYLDKVDLTKIKDLFKDVDLSQFGISDPSQITQSMIPDLMDKFPSKVLGALPDNIQTQLISEYPEILEESLESFVNLSPQTISCGICSIAQTVCKENKTEIKRFNYMREINELYLPRQIQMDVLNPWLAQKIIRKKIKGLHK